ncbi:hypothetical protein ACEPAH_2997 [Sanghuangporus vaninii]
MASRILAQAGPSTIYHSPFRKLFSTTASASQTAKGGSGPHLGTDETKGETHYDTLGIPHGASRMEIKAAYFRLSKRYHPDVRRSVRLSTESNALEVREGTEGVQEEREKEADKKATERFHEVSAAYKVLSDDRQRRAYDRSIASSHIHRSRIPHAHAHTPGSSHTHTYAYELHTHRKRGATHAWENTGPRASTSRTHTHAQTHPQTSASGAGVGAGRHYDPSSSPFAQYQSATSNQTSSSARRDSASQQSERLSGRALRAEEERQAHDRIVRESNVARFFRALSVVLIVTWVGSLGKTLGS